MNKLLKLQLRNAFLQKSFYICTILYLLSSFIASFALGFLSPSIKNPIMTIFTNSLLSIPITLVIFIILFNCMDYTDSTLKNIIARGYTKKDYITSKILSTLICILIINIIGFLVCTLLFIKNGFGYTSNMKYIIIGSLFTYSALTVFYTGLTIICGKTSTSIIAGLLGPTSVSLALSIIDAKFDINISKFWIDNLISMVTIKNPAMKDLLLVILVSIIYIIVIIIITNIIFKNKEIK